MTNQIKYKWASLGTGVIANELAQALEALGGKLYSQLASTSSVRSLSL